LFVKTIRRTFLLIKAIRRAFLGIESVRRTLFLIEAIGRALLRIETIRRAFFPIESKSAFAALPPRAASDRIHIFPHQLLGSGHLEERAVRARAYEGVAIGQTLRSGEETGIEIRFVGGAVTPNCLFRAEGCAFLACVLV